jgi:hypothetical protein
MEDAICSRFRLVFRGWFYSTDFVDIWGDVKQYFVSRRIEKRKSKKRAFWARSRTFVYLIEENNVALKANQKKGLKDEVKLLSDYVKTLTEEKGSLKSPKYFYEVEFNKPEV